MEEIVDIVDENDRFVRKATRDEMMEKGLLHRAARVIVVNGKGEYLVHKRAAAKKIYPGRWDIGIAETLVSGEGYEAAAIRGLAEELGIHGVSNMELKSSLLFKLRYASEINNAWLKVYEITYDGAITPQADEIEAVQFLPLNGVIELSKGDNFSPSGKFVLDNYLEVGPY
ncbi:NUDIX domain-containing protein [Candidatus Woesearchaeota archaeon]|nr:NUDIX domain-containing protein [Candidatus Woesearchaeota archaeon]